VIDAKTHSEELLRQLSTSVVPVEDAARAAARRERVVAELGNLVTTLPARRQRRRRLAWAASVSSAAAAALAIGFFSRTHPPAQRSESRSAPSAVIALEGSVQVIHRAAEMVAPPLERVPVGSADEVVTGKGGRARASLASGAEVDIDPDSKVRLSGNDGAHGAASAGSDEAVVLGAGRVTVRVPKLGPARSFAVETPEATIVVHGTAFSVERSTGAAGETPRTSVEVTEGSVAVRRHGAEVLLHAGDRWSSAWSPGSELDSSKDSDARATAPDRLNKPKSTGSPPRGANGSAAKGSAEGPSSDKSSSLAAENRLLQAAMAARQQGDPRHAAQLAGELVTRYPASPLVEEARVERMRALLGAGGPTAADGEARAYLADYPRGFARQEANRILAGVPR
jgi:ferric-dicitrate binding protein FerR (iron transport regulator)